MDKTYDLQIGTFNNDQSVASGLLDQINLSDSIAVGKIVNKSFTDPVGLLSLPTNSIIQPGNPAIIGMSATQSTWDTRVSEVQARGGHLKARRIFLGSLPETSSLIQDALDVGMYPVISYKLGTFSWSDCASGSADAQARTARDYLGSFAPDRMFVCLNHEPGQVSSGTPGVRTLGTDDSNDPNSTPEDFRDMCLRILPILQQSSNVDVGVIMNGWMFIGSTSTSGPNTSSGNGLNDAELARWLGSSMISLCDVVAADHYQTVVTGQLPHFRLQRHIDWAIRVGAIGVGVGEFNTFDAQEITDIMELGLNHPLTRWMLHWNNAASKAGILTGQRLTNFQNELIARQP